MDEAAPLGSQSDYSLATGHSLLLRRDIIHDSCASYTLVVSRKRVHLHVGVIIRSRGEVRGTIAPHSLLPPLLPQSTSWQPCFTRPSLPSKAKRWLWKRLGNHKRPRKHLCRHRKYRDLERHLLEAGIRANPMEQSQSEVDPPTSAFTRCFSGPQLPCGLWHMIHQNVRSCQGASNSTWPDWLSLLKFPKAVMCLLGLT